jgi:hypothetical protein
MQLTCQRKTHGMNDLQEKARLFSRQPLRRQFKLRLMHAHFKRTSPVISDVASSRGADGNIGVLT